MAAVAAVGSLLYEGYQAVSANQESQKAKGTAQTLIDQMAAKAKADTAQAGVKAAQAGDAARKKAKGAQGQASTILTGPQGAPPAPTERKTLLGL